MLYKNDWSSIQNIPLQEIRMNKYNILQRIKQYIHQLRMQRADEQRVEPLPGQDKETFLAYCMDSAIMTNEYPDTAQRYAVCQSYWSNKTE